MRPALLCAAAAALLAVCQGCSTGRDFIATFLPNYAGIHDKKLYLLVTARDSEARVHVEVGSLKFSTQLTLSPGETRRVPLPIGAMLTQPLGLPDSAVHISSTADVSVVAVNHRDYTGDGAVVMPTSHLGVSHVVFTPTEGPMDKVVALVNGDRPNKVTLRPAKKAQVKGADKWLPDKNVSVALKPYETYLVQSKNTLTGMQITSREPLAVFAGHQCVSIHGSGCDHQYKQLPPLSQLGTEYMVPTATSDAGNSWAVIVAAEDNVVVSVNRGKGTTKRTLKKAGQFMVESVPIDHPLLVKGTKRLMVIFLSRNKKPHDPFMIPLLPSEKLANSWSLDTLEGPSSTAVIFSEQEGSSSVKVCSGSSCGSIHNWKQFHASGSKWVWANVGLGKGQKHLTVEGDSDMVVYVYGGGDHYGYATAGVCFEPRPPVPPPHDPCEGVSCREKEACVKGSCVHVSTAKCQALGDPHYQTFDGRRFDFQGTCTYVMATVAQPEKGLTPFTVTTKNDHRGNRRVSFVRTVTITIDTLSVVISRHRGRVQVNGDLVYLPFSWSGGRVSVRQSGQKAVLTTDFGLTVSYDWNSRLYITVPSSYYRHLGGLCGNYNGDRKDDLPGGASVSNVLTMVQPWKVKDSDRFCSDNCGNRCPYCSKPHQVHYGGPTLCGLLSKPDGPFASCYATVNPEMYIANCVYDVCTNQGAKQILCDNLKSYSDSCLSEGVKFSPDWRTIAKCPLPCPAGSHYEACGSACPSSCMARDTEAACKSRCVEGCFCDKGLVLSGEKCVPLSSCGCQHQGRYYPQGSSFWADDKCSGRCHCDPGSGKMMCSSVGCKSSEKCSVKDGVRDCYPLSFATCQGTGDPHYRTFDGRRYDFQGTCTYVLSQTRKSSPVADLVHFQTLVQNENRGRNKAVSYTKSVSLTVYNFTISMNSDSPGKVLVNSRSVNLPYTALEGKLSLFRQGCFCFVQTQFGLTLKFNWKSHVSLMVPSTYAGSVEGLCGDYNGISADDLQKPDKSPAKGPTDFGDSFKVGGGIGCTSECPGGKCPVCEPKLALRYQERDYCGVIADKEGPFRHCHAKVDHTAYLNDCVFDLCAYKGYITALCNSLASYLTVCQTAGAPVENWRTKQFCPLPCRPNSHYETCAEPCPQTCDGMVPPQACDVDAPCSEDCGCDDGFMLSDDKCVPIAECGCQYNEQYYRSEQVFYPGADCRSRCLCLEGQVQCNDSFTCSANEKCDLEAGVVSCVPKTSGSCSVSGSRTVRGLDGQSYPLWGDCAFLLLEVEEEQGGGQITGFSVSIQQSTSEKGHVLRSVTLKAYGVEVTMRPGVLWEITIDDIRTNLPLSFADGKMWAHQSGSSIVIKTDFDLQLTYDTQAGVELRLPSTFAGAAHGLCGNFNGDPSDDFTLAGQTGGSSVADFTAACALKEVPCEPGCQGGSTCPTQAPIESPKACDVIKSAKGPFAGCHTAVSPLPYFQACVTELSGGQYVVCRHIQAYVSACQSAGATVANWRVEGFCPASCPSGTHYELCPDTCSATCASLALPGTCPRCHEGCQCDGEGVFDGGRCVPVERCGCLEDGQYYQSGVSVVLEDCSEKCECRAGRFNCSATSCQDEEECDVKDGMLGCYPLDPCAAAECREKEHCEVQEGQGVCVPVSEARCWAFGDPHYSTFDGWGFSFQGTCTYVVVNTTGRFPELPSLTVLAKNELRGNSEGSFVRSVTVQLLGHTIHIPNGGRGSVLVDGIKEDLPVDLDGGSISIIESGIRGLIQTELGIEVAFDWSTLIMVTLSSSYYGNVDGLCGNYNGQKEDELSGGVGSHQHYANVTEWAGSWSVADGDPFCYHHCEGECPQCSQDDQKKFTGPEYCGVAGDKKGPFASCHLRVDIREFMFNCLYDVCVNEGRQEVLCETLSSYSIACQKAGVTVSPWREAAKCPLPCPLNSHYMQCGPACPETCSPKPDLCPSVCSEGCFCDPGYVLSGEKCVVKATSCGCNHEGHYYLPGEVFWANDECQHRCVCDAATQRPRCEDRGCRAHEHCAVRDGVRDCFPLSFKTCSAEGDPHFRTFDGRKFDFQGNCVYNFASVCKDTKGLEKFQVSLENNNRGSTRVSYAKTVTVIVYGHTYSISKDNKRQVLVDGENTYLPFRSNQSLVQVYQRHRWVILETSFLKVSYDGSSALKVKVATTYQNMLCGLCGNFNTDPHDDLTLANGKAASSTKEFGISQWLANVPGCSHECKDCAPELGPGFVPPPYTAACEVIRRQDGPLRHCAGLLDSERYHGDCVFDMVQTPGDKGPAGCDIISNYVDDCQEEGGKVEEWRTKDFCWMQCPAHSVYSLAAPGCPATCGALSPSSQCDTVKGEGCVCQHGYVLNQDDCVPLSQCGCRFEGHYILAAATFYTHGCTRSCQCNGGVVTCVPQTCSHGNGCQLKKGAWGCYPKKPVGILEHLHNLFKG